MLLDELDVTPFTDEEEANARRYKHQFMPNLFPARRDKRFFLPPEEGGFRYECVDTIERFDEITADVKDRWIGGDVETNGLDFSRHHVVGFSFALSPYEAYYVPFRHLIGKNCPEKEIVPRIRDFHYRNKWVYYYWTFDGPMLANEGLDLERIPKLMDAAALVYNTDSNMKQINLKWASAHFLGRPYPTFEETLGGKGAAKSTTFDMIRPKEGTYYACADAACTLGLFFLLSKLLLQDYPARYRRIDGGRNLSIWLDNRLSQVMALYYLRNPIYFDHKAMAKLRDELIARRDELRDEIVAMMAPHADGNINLNSPDQVVEVLQKMGLDTGARTEKGAMSLSAKVLERLDHPLFKKIVERNSTSKQLTGYIGKLSKIEKGYINYKIFNLNTGRLASGKDDDSNSYFVPLNYQNLTKPGTCLYRAEFEGDDPDNTELIRGWRFTQVSNDEARKNPDALHVEGFRQDLNIRNAVTVPENDRKTWYFVGADFSQEELRVIGGLSREPLYLKAFEENRDIYKTVGSAMHHIPYEQVVGSMRKAAKAAVLGLNYEGDWWTLVRQHGMEEEEAKETVRAYRRSVPRLERWKASQIQYVTQGPGAGVVRTAWGRPRRLLWYLGSSDYGLRQQGERFIVNTIVQGTSADVMRILLCEMYERLFKPYPDLIRFVGCVHDEIDLAIRKDALDDMLPRVRELMEITPPDCACPLTVEFEIGYSYGYLFPFTFRDGQWVPQAA